MKEIDFDNKCISLFTFSETGWDQERVDLGLRKKVTVYLTPEEVYKFEVPTDKDIKLVIKGSESASKTIAKVQKIQDLKKQGVKVVFKTIQNAELSQTVTQKMSYVDRLLLEISNDFRSMSWYNKIFA